MTRDADLLSRIDRLLRVEPNAWLVSVHELDPAPLESLADLLERSGSGDSLAALEADDGISVHSRGGGQLLLRHLEEPARGGDVSAVNFYC